MTTRETKTAAIGKWTLSGDLLTIIAIMSVSVMAMAFLQPILPLYLTTKGVSPSVLGLMFSVGMVGMVIGEVSGGWIADRIGIKIPLIVGTFVCAPIVVGFVFARSTASIFLVFLFWGIIRATIFGPGRGYIGRIAPLDNKATFMAIYATVMHVTRSLGLLASGFIADNWGYNWTFLFSGGISVVAGILVVVRLRKVPLVTSGTDAVRPQFSGQTLTQKPPVNLRSFVVQCFLAGFHSVGNGIYSFLPLLATQVFGATATQVGMLLTIDGVVTSTLFIIFGKLADRRGKKLLIVSAFLLTASAFAGLALAKDFPLLILSMLVKSLSQAMFNPAAVALLSDTVPAYWQSTAMGIYGAAGEDVGSIIGSAAAGGAWTAWGSSSAFMIGTVSNAIGAIVTYSFVAGKSRKGQVSTAVSPTDAK